MSEEIKGADAYKIFRQLEERKKRANPYTFYDKDELIDEILKQEDEIEDLQQKLEQLEKELQTTANKCKQLENARKEAIEYNYKLQENYSHGALFEDKIAVNVYKVAEENLNILYKGSESNANTAN